MRKVLSVLLLLSFFLPSISFGAACDWGGGQITTSWLYCRTVTLTNSASSTVPAMAVSVQINSSTLDMTKVQSAGQDIRFTNTSGVILPRHHEFWAGTNGTSSSAFLPSATIATGTTSFSMYYGNTGAPNLDSPTSTYPTSTYTLAADLTDTAGVTTSTVLDNTGYANNGVASSTPQNATSTNCKIGGCEFATSTWISITTSTSLSALANTSSTLTTSATIGVWVNLQATTSAIIFSKSDNNQNTGWVLSNNAVTLARFEGTMVNNGNDTRNNTTATLTTSTWNHLVMTMNTVDATATSSMHIFKNGIEIAYTGLVAGSSFQANHSTIALTFGFSIYSQLKASGYFDQAKAFSSILSSSSIYFWYQSENNNVLSFGAEQNAPSATTAKYTFARGSFLLKLGSVTLK